MNWIAGMVVVFHLINMSGAPAKHVAAVEAAVTQQANTQLAPIWGTPQIRFDPNVGIPIYLDHDAGTEAACGFANAGCHDFADQVSDLKLYVSSDNDGYPDWSVVLSHEVLETLVDPDGSRPEVCDPVYMTLYHVDGIWVEDFITPAGKSYLTKPHQRAKVKPHARFNLHWRRDWR